MEIERKFEIKQEFEKEILDYKNSLDIFNDYQDWERKDVVFRTKTFYLKDPDSNYEMRVRQYLLKNDLINNADTEFTIKSKNSGISRIEWEFFKLSNLMIEEFIQKSLPPIYCERFDYKGMDIHFLDNNYLYAEIEFPTEEDANKFAKPDFLGNEIKFSLNNYAYLKNSCISRFNSII